MHIEAQAGCGVEVTGVDLSDPGEKDLAGLRELFAEHGLLLFRDQQLSENQHIELAAGFGAINVNRFFAAHPDYPQIALVAKEPEHTTNIGGGWHTDHSYDTEPALGSILVARELPPAGGDTWFVSMYDAFAALSPGLQQTLLGLRAVHSARHVFGARAAYQDTDVGAGRVGNTAAAEALQDVVHPAVIRHPLSGRPALYVNPAFTLRFEGWTAEESAPLLQYLYQAAVDETRVCRFRWAPGSVAFWDNRATWHFAQNDYHGERREMHRITIDGGPLTAA